MNGMRPMKVKPTKEQALKMLERYPHEDLHALMRFLPALEQEGMISAQQTEVMLEAILELFK